MSEGNSFIERRSNADLIEMIARIDERTKTIVEQLPAKASCESVDRANDRIERVEQRVDEHIKRGQWNAATIISLICALAAIGSVIVAFVGIHPSTVLH
jgi:hypothetical protein